MRLDRRIGAVGRLNGRHRIFSMRLRSKSIGECRFLMLEHADTDHAVLRNRSLADVHPLQALVRGGGCKAAGKEVRDDDGGFGVARGAARADLDRACGNRIHEGDIVILDSNWKFPPFTPETNSPADKRLFINAETAIWMRDHKVKCVGFGDGVSIENCEEDVKPFHDIIMAYDGVFLEVLKNLEYLKKDTFFMSYSPLPIVGADSCPVRAYAIEGLPGFSE